MHVFHVIQNELSFPHKTVLWTRHQHLTRFLLLDMEVSNFPVKQNCNEHPLITKIFVFLSGYFHKANT